MRLSCLLGVWGLLLCGCPGENTGPCSGVTCGAGRTCVGGQCVPIVDSGPTDKGPGGDGPKGDGLTTDGPKGDGPRPDGPQPFDLTLADKGPCAGGCDDKDPCTYDSCVKGVCKHTAVIPTTCGNTTIEACEICDGTQPLGSTQLCFNCNEIGMSFAMFNRHSTNIGNGFFSVVGTNQFDLKVTCNGSRVITYIGKYCEHGSIIAKAGGLMQKTVTISCTQFAGNNESVYEFRCGPAN